MQQVKQQLVFLEGPACIGKTTNSMTTFDFTIYLEKYAKFAAKQELSHINSLYEQMLTVDVMDFIANIQMHAHTQITTPKFVDRSHLSSLIYNILFYCDGHILEHDSYKQHFEQTILADKTYCAVFTDMCTKSWRLLQKLAPSLDIVLLCVLPNNIDRVVANLQRRNSFEVAKGFDLKAYTQNQIYTFETLFKMANIGRILHTDNEFINTHEMYNFINQQ